MTDIRCWIKIENKTIPLYFINSIRKSYSSNLHIWLHAFFVGNNPVESVTVKTHATMI